jgi:hypothetical protein
MVSDALFQDFLFTVSMDQREGTTSLQPWREFSAKIPAGHADVEAATWSPLRMQELDGSG